MKKITLILPIIFFGSNLQAAKVEGTFKATKSCPAYKSFKQGGNPGNIYSIPDRIYKVVEENKPEGPWALIIIPEISHARRWVAKECGITTIRQVAPSKSTESCNVANNYDSNVLALSWQAGFCEHSNYSGVKLECDNLNEGHISVTNLTIHGLWPNKNSCAHHYGNCSNEPLDLKETTVNEISPWMPNFYYSTKFGNHEWTKHGTCQSLNDDDYFLLIKRLAEKFDNSALGQYIRNNIGQDIQVADMKAHLISALGKDVTNKIELRCTGAGKRYLNEFWINLPKELNESGNLADLISGAKDKSPFRGNCATTIHIEAPGV